MARLIDADKIPYKKETECLGHGMYMDTESVTKETIDKLPTVDAVEVVRCEKCRYYEKAEYDEGYKMVCRLLKRQTASNGFCYCGEKTDGYGNGT